MAKRGNAPRSPAPPRQRVRLAGPVRPGAMGTAPGRSFVEGRPHDLAASQRRQPVACLVDLDAAPAGPGHPNLPASHCPSGSHRKIEPVPRYNAAFRSHEICPGSRGHLAVAGLAGPPLAGRHVGTDPVADHRFPHRPPLDPACQAFDRPRLAKKPHGRMPTPIPAPNPAPAGQS